MHTKNYYALGTLYFTELLYTCQWHYCVFGWLHAGQVLLVARSPLLWNQPICWSTSPNIYGPRSKMLIIVYSFDCFVFPAVPRPPWQNHALRMYMPKSGAQRSASVGSRDTSQGKWEWPVAVIWLPDFIARLVRQVRLIQKSYVIRVQNGFFDFIPRFATLCGWENLSMHQCSVLFNWAITNLLLNMLRWFASSCEGRISLAVLVKVEERNQGSLLLLSLVTDASMVRKRCWLLEGKATQPVEQQAENRSNYYVRGTSY